MKVNNQTQSNITNSIITNVSSQNNKVHSLINNNYPSNSSLPKRREVAIIINNSSINSTHTTEKIDFIIKVISSNTQQHSSSMIMITAAVQEVVLINHSIKEAVKDLILIFRRMMKAITPQVSIQINNRDLNEVVGITHKDKGITQLSNNSNNSHISVENQ